MSPLYVYFTSTSLGRTASELPGPKAERVVRVLPSFSTYPRLNFRPLAAEAEETIPPPFHEPRLNPERMSDCTAGRLPPRTTKSLSTRSSTLPAAASILSPPVTRTRWLANERDAPTLDSVAPP